MKVNIFLIFLTMVMVSCNKKSPDCGDPTPSYCKIILVDKNDNLLVGATYPENTIKLTIANQTIPLIFDNEVIVFSFVNLQKYNNQDFTLTLGENEFDRLNLHIRTITNECWTSEILDTLKYNRLTINPLTGNTYKIIK